MSSQPVGKKPTSEPQKSPSQRDAAIVSQKEVAIVAVRETWRDKIHRLVWGVPAYHPVDGVTKERRNQLLWEAIVAGARTTEESDLREALYEVVRLEQEPIGFWNPTRWIGRPSLEARAKQLARARFDEANPRSMRERVPYIGIRCIAFSEKSSIDQLKRFVLEEVLPVFNAPLGSQRAWVDFYERKLAIIKSPAVSIVSRHAFDAAWAFARNRGFVAPAKPYGHKDQEEAWRTYWLAMLEWEARRKEGEAPPTPPDGGKR